jgi:hypothetical protein
MRNYRLVFVSALVLLVGAAIGYYLGYDHGWEQAVQSHLSSAKQAAALW